MIPVDTFTLDNGLRVVHSFNPHAALAVVDVLYDTGARDESPALTGMAHLFEHLMFGGSANVPDFDAVLERAGGRSNAFTTADFTNFYEILPVQNIDTAFYLESDRMLGLAFSDHALEVQRRVVVEEFKQVCLNQPYGTLMHKLRPMLYGPEHPYSWPVIGIEPAHIEKVTRDDVRRWFYEHYAPNNAILCVVGNITAERLRQLAEKWFGPIPSRAIAPRMIADGPWPTGEARTLTVHDSNAPCARIDVAYRMAAYGEPGYLAADAITDILAAGPSSRLYQRLVLGTDLFSSANAAIVGSEHSGMLMLNGILSSAEPEALSRAQDLLIGEARQLAEPGNVTEYELERTKNRYESTFAFENMNPVQLARTLAMSAYHGQDVNSTVDAYRALTLADIAATARDIFIDHAPAILTYLPAK